MAGTRAVSAAAASGRIMYHVSCIGISTSRLDLAQFDDQFGRWVSLHGRCKYKNSIFVVRHDQTEDDDNDRKLNDG